MTSTKTISSTPVGADRNIRSSNDNFGHTIQNAENSQQMSESQPQVKTKSMVKYDVKTGEIDTINLLTEEPNNDQLNAAASICEEHFAGLDFKFEKFAEINKIPYNSQCIPNSDNIRNSFASMRIVADDLLNGGIAVNTTETESFIIKLTDQEIIDANEKVENLRLSSGEDKAYALYGELGIIILSKFFYVVNAKSFDEQKKSIANCLSNSYDLCKHLLYLPLANFNKGTELCTRLFQLHKYDTSYFKDDSRFNVAQGSLLTNGTTSSDFHLTSNTPQQYVDEFKQLGIFCAFKDKKLADGILPAAQFAISLGMTTPLFVTEFEYSKYNPAGISYDFDGIMINSSVMSFPAKLVNKLSYPDFNILHLLFHHENTHHARSAVGAIHTDNTLGKKDLSKILQGHDDIIYAILSQISTYALTNYEEYIAEFSSLVLCCLEPKETEQGKIEPNANPFDYIKDERLWRLYYEFGGPDFAPIIQQKGFLPAGYAKSCDILSDKKCNWCSGYPEKFDIIVSDLGGTVCVRVGSTKYDTIAVKIDSNTVLPPPPIGYHYATNKGYLELLNTENNKRHQPNFCRMTNGTLTLMNTTLPHHFDKLNDLSQSSNNSLIGSVWNCITALINKATIGIFNFGLSVLN